MGAVTGIPKLFCEHRFIATTESPSIMPKRPQKPLIKIKAKRRIVIDSYNEGTTNALIAVNATTITIGEPIIPAVTAASPIIKAPTILTA